MPSQEKEGFVCLFLSSWFVVGFLSMEGGLGLVSHLKSEWWCLGTSLRKEVYLWGKKGDRAG